MKIKCIIIDDEHLARELLVDYISKLPQLELVAKCYGVPQAMEVLQNESIDLIFLDVQMPDISGIDFLKSLTIKPIVILTTAYPEYALDGYSLDVIDYLLKPISFERFVQSVNKASDQFNFISRRDNNLERDYITIRSEHKIHKVNYNNILYIEGAKEYVIFYLKEGGRIITLEALKRLEDLLPNNFMRIHKSHIINKDEVRSLYGNMVEIGSKKILIGKTYKELVLNKIFK